MVYIIGVIILCIMFNRRLQQLITGTKSKVTMADTIHVRSRTNSEINTKRNSTSTDVREQTQQTQGAQQAVSNPELSLVGIESVPIGDDHDDTNDNNINNGATDNIVSRDRVYTLTNSIPQQQPSPSNVGIVSPSPSQPPKFKDKNEEIASIVSTVSTPIKSTRLKKIKLNFDDKQLVAVMTQNTTIVTVGVSSSVIACMLLATGALYFNAFVASICTFLATFDATVNVVCLALQWSFANKKYKIICFYCHSTIKLCYMRQYQEE